MLTIEKRGHIIRKIASIRTFFSPTIKDVAHNQGKPRRCSRREEQRAHGTKENRGAAAGEKNNGPRGTKENRGAAAGEKNNGPRGTKKGPAAKTGS